jgi:protein-tyrosine phosphatase
MDLGRGGTITRASIGSSSRTLPGRSSSPDRSAILGEMALVTIRAAVQDELDVAAGILEEASAWLAGRGHQGWPAGAFFDDGAYGRRSLRRALAAAELQLVLRDDQPVGTVTVQWSDPVIWPDDSGDAGYIHRLALAGDAHGLGLGLEVLSWAERRILARGRRYARLDCRADDPGIRGYYERAGYRHRGEIEHLGLSRYEKDLSPAGNPG